MRRGLLAGRSDWHPHAALWFAVAVTGQLACSPWISAFARVARTRYLYYLFFALMLALASRLVRHLIFERKATAVVAGAAAGYLSSVLAFLLAELSQAGGWGAFLRGVDKLGIETTLVTTWVGTFMLLGWLIGGLCGLASYAIHRTAS
jgi:hypothetical protein